MLINEEVYLHHEVDNTNNMMPGPTDSSKVPMMLKKNGNMKLPTMKVKKQQKLGSKQVSSVLNKNGTKKLKNKAA